MQPLRLTPWILSACLFFSPESASAEDRKIDWDALLKKTGTKPIVVPEKSLSTDQVEELYRKWGAARVVEPELARLKGAPDEKEIAGFFKKAHSRWAQGQLADAGTELVRAAEAVVNGETRRPLVDFFAAHVLKETGNRAASMKGYRHVAEAGYESSFPSLFRVLAQVQLVSNAEAHDKGSIKKEETRYFEILGAHLSETPVDDEDARWILFYHMYGDLTFVRKTREKRHTELYKQSKLPEWTRLTLAGDSARARAWRESGEGRGYPTAKPEDIKRHMDDAAASLTKAWELKPTMPYAAMAMIVVADKSGSGTPETLRMWLDRAIAAQFDIPLAYTNYLRGIRPFWGGDEEQNLAFGWACAATGRHDTNLPTRFNDAVFGVAYGKEDWRTVYRNPAISKPLLEIREKRLKACAAQPLIAIQQAGQLCVEAWAVGDMALAAKALDSMHSPSGEVRYADIAADLAWQLGMDEKFIFSEAWQHHGEGKADYVAGVAAMDAKDFDEASKRFQSGIGKVNREGLPLLQGMIALADFQQRFEKGGWARIPLHQRHCWSEFDGENIWDAESKRMVITGSWIFGKGLFRGKLGTRFEVRGHFTTKPEGRSGAGFGIYAGHSPLTTGRGAAFWWTLRVDAWSNEKNGVHFAPKYAGDDHNKVVQIDRNDDSTFLYRRDGDKVTFYVNDREVVKDKPMDGDAPGGECAWGIGVLGQGKGAAAEVWELEARKLEDK